MDDLERASVDRGGKKAEDVDLHRAAKDQPKATCETSVMPAKLALAKFPSAVVVAGAREAEQPTRLCEGLAVSTATPRATGSVSEFSVAEVGPLAGGILANGHLLLRLIPWLSRVTLD
jgi:hypothetical protein